MEVLKLHLRVSERSGGALGVRDLGRLESAIVEFATKPQLACQMLEWAVQVQVPPAGVSVAGTHAHRNRHRNRF